jgi:hypothetical protein
VLGGCHYGRLYLRPNGSPDIFDLLWTGSNLTAGFDPALRALIAASRRQAGKADALPSYVWLTRIAGRGLHGRTPSRWRFRSLPHCALCQARPLPRLRREERSSTAATVRALLPQGQIEDANAVVEELVKSNRPRD